VFQSLNDSLQINAGQQTINLQKDELFTMGQADDPTNRLKRNLVALLCRDDKRM
jgi:hypothetical protein